ncbi:MAG: zinc ABC transporter substrate-binding protein [Clostridia bacterium]|nr:zinc ABC transporter substrate-binding protein [Clostridia bacterium]
MNKKLVVLAMSLLIVLLCLFGCSGPDDVSQNTEKIKVVCTTFPEYDWVRQIAGEQLERIDLTLLLDNGIDLHSYQPSTEDVLTISGADLFIYTGGESDGWVEDALVAAANEDRIALSLMNILKNVVKEEELVEGMQASEHEHEHEAEAEDHEHEAEDHEHEAEDHEHETEYDEHVWLSIKNASEICKSIAEALATLDEENASVYSENLEAYQTKLSELDGRYAKAVSEATYKTVLFGDRFPFRYLVDDYGLAYYAAFVGCSAETEASFKTVTFLAQKVEELGLPAVLVIENSNQAIARTIIENTSSGSQKILIMDSIQSITTEDLQNGKTYLSIMESNLDVLVEALN